MSEDSRSSARRALAVSVVLTLAVYWMPYGHLVGRPLIWLSTLVHELGHGFTAILVGQNFDRFVMYPDASGAASWSGNPGRIGRALISAGGLVGPAIGAAGFFLAARTPRGARTLLGALGVVSLLIALIWVRNLFAFAFVVSLGAICAGIAWRGSEQVARIALSFLGVQLALSVFSRSDYLFMAEARTGAGVMPSDVAHMAEALWLPYWFWGAVCGLFSVAVVAGGLWLAVGPDEEV